MLSLFEFADQNRDVISVLSDDVALWILGYVYTYEKVEYAEILDSIEVTGDDIKLSINRLLDSGFLEMAEERPEGKLKVTRAGKSLLKLLGLIPSVAVKTQFQDKFLSHSECRDDSIISPADKSKSGRLAPISVSNEYAIPCSEGFVVSDASWSAYVTSIPAQWLYELYQIHKTNLFPAYVRDNLASNTSDKVANENIKQAAADDPRNLWVYNNGITCLVNDFMIMAWGKKQINVKGIAIITGIQTTMAIGNMKYPPDEKAKIQVRFIKCANEETEQRVMSYNNSPDKVPAADIRKTEVVHHTN